MQDEPKTVFIVTSGSYSEYGIRSVWEKREDAEAEAARMNVGIAYNYNLADVEEWVLNQQPYPIEVVRWRAQLWESGEIKIDDRPERYAEIPKTAVWTPSMYPNRTYSFGYGVSPDHARKALADAVAAYKANREGLTS